LGHDFHSIFFVKKQKWMSLHSLIHVRSQNILYLLIVNSQFVITFAVQKINK